MKQGYFFKILMQDFFLFNNNAARIASEEFVVFTGGKFLREKEKTGRNRFRPVFLFGEEILINEPSLFR
jgi:hypothetical protein